LVLGGHSDTMVPVLSCGTINGIPVRQIIPQDRLDAIVQRTRNSGTEVVRLMGSSAYYAPASGAVQMARSYLYDEKRLLPCTAFLRGEYGLRDIYMGVPVILGGGGVEKVVIIDLDPTERQMLERSAAAVRELLAAAERL